MIEFFHTLHWGVLFQIVMIDLLLGGDNAVVIALACRKLAPRQRIQGILWGTAGAILLRVVLIFSALTLLDLPFLKLAGAVLLMWVGVKLLLPDSGRHDGVVAGQSVITAVKTILVADAVMSLDNVLAIAGAAQGSSGDHQMGYVIFGLLLSVPVIVWGSTVVLKMIDRFPLVVTLGAALLGWIAGGMLVTDVVIASRFDLISSEGKLGAEIAGALLVITVGKYLASRKDAVLGNTHGSVQTKRR